MVAASLSFPLLLLLHLASPAPAADAKEVAQVHNPALGEVVQVVPPPTGDGGKGETKRAALLLDKIMFAVQKALDEREKPGGGKKGGSWQHQPGLLHWAWHGAERQCT